MGVFSSTPKKDTNPKTLKQKAMESQEFISQVLYDELLRFNKSQIEQILAIPLTDYHMVLTFEEVTIIIRRSLPKMGIAQAKLFANAITQGYTLNDKLLGWLLTAMFAFFHPLILSFTHSHQKRVGKKKVAGNKRREIELKGRKDST